MKECPFCKSSNVSVIGDAPHGHCHKCGADGPRYDEDGNHFKSNAAAEKAWNERGLK